MTRLTNDLREQMFHKIMKGIPNRNYQSELFYLVQGVVRDFMPKKLQAVYDDPKLRKFLSGNTVKISAGNRTHYLYGEHDNTRFGQSLVLGVEKELTIRMADLDMPERIPAGTMYQHLLFKTDLAQLFNAWMEQEELRKQVEKRLKANLAAATTIKRLYDVLEPDLHHYIPRETARESMLPATVAPVVDDLKKLGFVSPNVPKAEGAQA